jgi:hypothetical protein
MDEYQVQDIANTIIATVIYETWESGYKKRLLLAVQDKACSFVNYLFFRMFLKSMTLNFKCPSQILNQLDRINV